MVAERSEVMPGGNASSTPAAARPRTSYSPDRLRALWKMAPQAAPPTRPPTVLWYRLYTVKLTKQRAESPSPGDADSRGLGRLGRGYFRSSLNNGTFSPEENLC